MYYLDGGGIFLYLFNSLSGELMRVEGYIHNTTLNLYYSEGRLDYIEHSDSGKRLSVNYTSSGLIQSMELINVDGTVEKTK